MPLSLPNTTGSFPGNGMLVGAGECVWDNASVNGFVRLLDDHGVGRWKAKERLLQELPYSRPYGMNRGCFKAGLLAKKYRELKENPSAIPDPTRRGIFHDILQDLEQETASAITIPDEHPSSVSIKKEAAPKVSPEASRPKHAPRLPSKSSVRIPTTTNGRRLKNPYRTRRNTMMTEKKEKKNKKKETREDFVVGDPFPAEFEQKCSICKKGVSKGQDIHNTGGSGKPVWTHERCFALASLNDK